MDDVTEVICPVCSESFEVDVDPTGGEMQEWGLDCPVCCRPLSFAVELDDHGRLRRIDCRAE